MARKLLWIYGTALSLTLAATLALTGCGGNDGLNALNSREVQLPDGKVVVAETAVRPEELAKGLMYRDSLAPDRGMLFFHTAESFYPYWMKNCKISLDMIWLDEGRRIVEIAANVPPCPPDAENCPSYGGHEKALYVLELGAGQAAKHALRKGQRLEF
ncbi:MAG: DUF192 domain-containing protein [Bryobacteraceae bacterium]|nr:DUF192 domain-containing protein [Bryobacteraceae bacterium]